MIIFQGWSVVTGREDSMHSVVYKVLRIRENNVKRGWTAEPYRIPAISYLVCVEGLCIHYAIIRIRAIIFSSQ
jgi:hypothetical protein